MGGGAVFLRFVLTADFVNDLREVFFDNFCLRRMFLVLCGWFLLPKAVAWCQLGKYGTS